MFLYYSPVVTLELAQPAIPCAAVFRCCLLISTASANADNPPGQQPWTSPRKSSEVNEGTRKCGPGGFWTPSPRRLKPGERLVIRPRRNATPASKGLGELWGFLAWGTLY